jgi:uncharacterized protein YdeI (BOF family)
LAYFVDQCVNVDQSPGGGGQEEGIPLLQKEVFMKSLKLTSLAITIIGVGLVAALGTRAEARSPSESPSQSSPSKIVTGEVAQVEGEFHMAKDTQGELTLDIVDKFYVITSQAGEEVRLELDDNTKVGKRVNPGDKIEAKVSSKGHTLSVTRLEP